VLTSGAFSSSERLGRRRNTIHPPGASVGGLSSHTAGVAELDSVGLAFSDGGRSQAGGDTTQAGASSARIRAAVLVETVVPEQL
jgi:hypothetical protein